MVRQANLSLRSDRLEETAKLDARIRDLTQQLLDVKLQRNALAPIFALPDEVLFRIMFEYAWNMDIFSNKWMGIRSVCRRWYEVADSHAQLWSFVHFSNGTHTRDRMRKSKNYPLSCIFDPLHSGTEAQMVVHANCHRLRTLEIEGGDIEPFHWVFGETQALPLLETLSATYSGSKDQHLSLTMDDLLSILKRSPFLCDLIISGCFPTSPQTSITDSELVDLPFLERADLSGFSHSLEAFLRALTLPVTTALDITVFARLSAAKELASLLLPIRMHLCRPGAPVLRAICLLGSPALDCTVNAYTIIPPRQLILHAASAQFSLSVFPKDTGRQHIARKIFTQILNALPLKSVSHLDLSLNESRELTQRTFCAVFQHIPRVEVVRIGVNDGMLAVLEGLVDAVRRGPRGRSGARRRKAAKGIYWPTYLNLDASWNALYGLVGVSMIPEAQQVQWYDALEAWLAEYKAMDAPDKRAGVPWGTLKFRHVEGVYRTAMSYKERLSPLVEKLIISDLSSDSEDDADL
ncbi:hypothetical protein FA95DRAFT_1675547 [Auriscalpium vulgare]|uniref:Uncharacterized protein n=1 Tax=Auriscalpium vulgare TaxID=40419 RepID=A0ACB8S762_9AGAM|nr:hypothetical protein FA95DRAFT_1675547 [Auriscalpium vulgare]